MKKKKYDPYRPSPHRIEEFLSVIPSQEIELMLGKRESKRFWKFMGGQTLLMLERQPGIYLHDLERFLKGDWNLYD